MYKVPAKFKRSISTELKKFTTVIKNLQSKGKASSEDDARIIINDVLADVLGYDKYNEVKTEHREKNGRLDYVIKVSDSPYSKKKDQYDFVIEAKAAHVSLSQSHVNQTLQYCLTNGIDFFVLTNTVRWQLYSVKNTKRNSDANLIHEVNFGVESNTDNLAEEFYLFSKNSYLNGDWRDVHKVANATKVEDIVAVILSDKIIKSITKEVTSIHGVKVLPEQLKDIIENQIIKAEVEDLNKSLLRKINSKPSRKKTKDKSAKNMSPCESEDLEEQDNATLSSEDISDATPLESGDGINKAS